MKLLPHLALGLLLIHPAGAVDYLLVAQPATNSILRFNAQTGAAMGPLVASGSGGLASPRGMVLGPDGNLYVASAGSNRVKRFSIITGNPVGDGNFTPADLSVPVALKFNSNGDMLILEGSGQREVRRYNGTNGSYIATDLTSIQTRLSSPSDFLKMTGTDDF